MNQAILETIKEIKEKYQQEGFIILGLFGSYARNEETDKSDLDILYEINDIFLKKYRGFNALERLNSIKQELEVYFGRTVDITDRSALNEIGEKYILPEVKYV